MEDKTLIKIKGISKTYSRGTQTVFALQDVSLEIYRGEIITLLGVNGAGKTTLSSILATLHPPTAGDLIWKGKSIYSQLFKYRKIMGFCPQTADFEKGSTLEEHLLFAAGCYGLSNKDSHKRKDEMLERFELSSYAKAHINELSGGLKQRFMIAKALIHQPEFLILDEPTVGLDSHIRRQLWKLIEDLRTSRISVLLTTHYLDEAEILSDRVCLIHAGKIHKVDTPAHLKTYHQKNTLEEVFLAFVKDPGALLFK